MKPRMGWIVLVVPMMCLLGVARVRAQDTVAAQVGVMDERVKKLQAIVEDLQFRQDKLSKQIEELQANVLELRRASTGATAADLQALADRIKAVDEARLKDRQVILDTLAKQLAEMSGNHAGPKPPTPPDAVVEYTIQKGDTLTSIARANGVTVASLRKANNLTSDTNLQVGKKLIIPK